MAHVAELLTRLPEGLGLFHGLLDIPFVDDEPFDQPHRGRAIPTGAVDERWLGSVRGDGLQELIGGDGIGLAGEGDVKVPQSRRLGGRLFLVDLSARLRRYSAD